MDRIKSSLCSQSIQVQHRELLALRRDLWKGDLAVHTKFLPLVPDVLKFMETRYDDFSQSLGCSILQNYTLLELSHKYLIECGCVPHFIRIIKESSRLPFGADICALVSLANIISSSPTHKNQFPILSQVDIDRIADCFRACLHDRPFPEHNGLYWELWEMAMGICHIIEFSCNENLKMFLNSGFVRLLTDAISLLERKKVIVFNDLVAKEILLERKKETQKYLFIALWILVGAETTKNLF
eukprot:c5206_g1_i1.p1 GENE.c5206_g1_i1~~c5206_g1_i1.p1  ORF type:complete len:241 (-),score=64.24 c5206_g1_i1:17-739(-)